MATRIVSWGSNEHVTALSPSLSKAPSIVSVNSILSEKLSTSQNTLIADEPGAKHMSSQVIEPSRTRTSWTPNMCPWVHATDDSFIRHHKYFFEDGNVVFLVCGLQPWVVLCKFTHWITCRLKTHCIASTDISSLATQYTSPPDLPSSISVTTRPSLRSYPWVTSNVKTLMLSSLSCTLSEISGPLFISLLIKACVFFRNFEESDLSYEEWKSVLHLSTRWGFASLRKRALSSIEPPTPHDRLLLARTYSVNDWVVPALSALCERTTPLTLSEARQMSIEDVVLVSTVREHIRGCMLQVDSAEISLRVEAEQLIALGSKIPAHLRFPPHFPNGEVPSLMDPKRATKEDDRDAHESDDECSVSHVAVRSRGELVRALELTTVRRWRKRHQEVFA